MRIDKKQTICNIPVLKIRDFLKRCHRSSDFYANNFFKYIQVDETEGEKVVKELIKQGYIIQVNNLYKVTEKGQSLRVARCTPPF